MYLDTGDAHPFDFTASTEKKEALFQMGRKGALEFLKFGVRSHRPARRNSSPSISKWLRLVALVARRVRASCPAGICW
jgi:hypothetical protein